MILFHDRRVDLASILHVFVLVVLLLSDPEYGCLLLENQPFVPCGGQAYPDTSKQGKSNSWDNQEII